MVAKSPAPTVDAVLFDLFGTIVPPYLREPHHDALETISSVLGQPFDEVRDRWGKTRDARTTGGYATIADNLRDIAPTASSAALEEAHRIYHRFTVRSLVPKAGALDVLDWLDEHGVRKGLVTNCAPDVPELWSATRWSYRFGVAVFSCEFGARKPDPSIYLAALDQLGVTAGRAVFVGDGSDDELQGAAAVGMRTVLVRNDPDRTDPDLVPIVVGAVDDLSELRAVLAGL